MKLVLFDESLMPVVGLSKQGSPASELGDVDEAVFEYGHVLVLFIYCLSWFMRLHILARHHWAHGPILLLGWLRSPVDLSGSLLYGFAAVLDFHELRDTRTVSREFELRLVFDEKMSFTMIARMRVHGPSWPIQIGLRRNTGM